MPYVITARSHDHAAPLMAEQDERQSRRAVATLEEARQHVFVAVTSQPGYTAVVPFPTDAAVARSITESGGTIGPLLDGTVIEVESWTWLKVGDALYGAEPATRIAWAVQHADQSQPDSQRWLIDAYNARQS